MLTRELHGLGSTVDVELRDRIATIHANATALDSQSKQMRGKSGQLAKTTKTWGAMADSARGKLKVRFRLHPPKAKTAANPQAARQEIGDVQNWAELLEHDLLLIEETLRIVDEGDYDDGHQSSGSATL